MIAKLPLVQIKKNNNKKNREMLPLFSNCCNYWVGDFVFHLWMGGKISKNNVLNVVHAMQTFEKHFGINIRFGAQTH